MIWLIFILQPAIIAMSMSVDAFAVAFAYGCKKIKIPMLSLNIINLICSCIIGLSFVFGSAVVQHIPEWLSLSISFTILLILGIIKLFDSITKSIIRKYTRACSHYKNGNICEPDFSPFKERERRNKSVIHQASSTKNGGIISCEDDYSLVGTRPEFNKEIKLSVFNFKLIMRIYADPESVDTDVSKSISVREAIVLAISLSLDGFAVGFSVAMLGVNVWLVIIFTLITDFVALMFGSWLGNKVASKLKLNISWLAGAILIGLAIMQLL